MDLIEDNTNSQHQSFLWHHITEVDAMSNWNRGESIMYILSPITFENFHFVSCHNFTLSKLQLLIRFKLIYNSSLSTA